MLTVDIKTTLYIINSSFFFTHLLSGSYLLWLTTHPLFVNSINCRKRTIEHINCSLSQSHLVTAAKVMASLWLSYWYHIFRFLWIYFIYLASPTPLLLYWAGCFPRTRYVTFSGRLPDPATKTGMWSPPIRDLPQKFPVIYLFRLLWLPSLTHFTQYIHTLLGMGGWQHV